MGSEMCIRDSGTTILPWSRGKPLAWDVTVLDTYADAHVANSARQAGAVATHAANNMMTKYSQLARTHIFYPTAIETPGTWHDQAVELIREIGRQTTIIIGHLPVPAVVCGTPKGEKRSPFKAKCLKWPFPVQSHSLIVQLFVCFLLYTDSGVQLFLCHCKISA